MVSADNI